MQTAETNQTHGSTGSGPSIRVAHPRDDERVEIENTTPTDVNNRTENGVLFSHVDSWKNDHKRHVKQADGVSGHRTTFHVWDADIDEINGVKRTKRQRLNQQWKYQTGRGHTWDGDPYDKNIVRRDAQWKRCDAILQQCGVKEWERKRALNWIVSEELQGFSSHYAGADGACVGFALLVLFKAAEEAKRSWVAEQAAEVVPEFDSETVSKLVDYVFRKYD